MEGIALTEISRIQMPPALLEAIQAIGVDLDTDQVLQRLVQLTHSWFAADTVCVATVEANGTLVFQAVSGKGAEQITGMVLAQHTGMSGWVAEHGERAWTSGVHADPHFIPNELEGLEIAAILVVPVQFQGQTLAVLEMINPSTEVEPHEAMEIMAALASIAAPALRNARSYEQMRQTEAQCRGVFELSRDPVVIIDGIGKLLHINQAARRLLGITSDPHEAFSLAMLRLSAEEFNWRKEQAISGVVPVWELQLGTPEKRLFEVSLSHLTDYSTLGAFQWIGHDITDRVALEERRQRLSDMIVHDLRAPLSSVRNSLELTLTAWRQKDLTLPIEQVLQIGLRSAQRMDHLIENILDTARLQATENAITLSAIDVAVLVAEALDVVEASTTSMGHALVLDIQSDLPQMWGDHALLRRVLVNLLGNAVKYTPHSGEIRLHVSADDQAFHFAVSDNGPGIPPDEQEHVFELFYRGRSQNTHGVGLGLSFCKLAVNAHGGHIHVDSEVGRGSTFCFTIPRTLTGQALTAAEKPG